ncbi:MAG: Uracil DNA glycosylase superfamily protein [candidate division TM6 bacterium GW2011_GWF2_28_16]|nr:MAG: Uracil DNA glycosylase superfamily protein [candidate division TM6 bacterium GW2011_GWF2_28_16]
MNKQNILNKIKLNYNKCENCALAKQGRKQVVFGQGNPNANIMFIGEAPGKDEDIQGAPFVGRAGKLLIKMIEAIGYKREDAYISNVVKCRPPNNRTPLPNETNVCKKLILFKEIETINPKVICCLGASATQALLGKDIKISNSRGLFFNLNNIKIMPTFHPAYLLRNPKAKKQVCEDLEKINFYLENIKNRDNAEK